jgi:acyl dehydratase
MEAMTAMQHSDLDDGVGRTVGLSDWPVITQDAINECSRLTGHEQWIHTDPDPAEAGPFKRPIAHGFLTLALTSKLLEECWRLEGVTLAINY